MSYKLSPIHVKKIVHRHNKTKKNKGSKIDENSKIVELVIKDMQNYCTNFTVNKTYNLDFFYIYTLIKSYVQDIV